MHAAVGNVSNKLRHGTDRRGNLANGRNDHVHVHRFVERSLQRRINRCFTRALVPGGTWKYSRTLVTGTPGTGSTWTTTVIDPNSNYTVINAAEDSATATLATYYFYET